MATGTRRKKSDKKPEKKLPDNYLDLETVLAPETIGCKISGEWYDYGRRDLWSLQERANWNKYWKRLEQLEKLETLSDEQARLYIDAQTNLIKMAVPDLPRELARDMLIDQKIALLIDFLARTAHQTAGYMVMKGMGIQTESQSPMETIAKLIGEESLQTLTENGPTDGDIG